MGKAIFKVDDNGEERFLVWSSVVDAPVTFACTAKEIIEMFVEDAREDATRMAQDMIDRARATGSSSRMGYVTLAHVVAANRAGPNESTLTEDEIIEFYVRRNEDPTKAALAAYRKGKK
jgi:hypothetical protein